MPLLRNGAESARLALSAKSFALLAILVVEGDRSHLRARLAERLWPDVADDKARANLRRHLHLLSRALPADSLTATKEGVQWNGTALDCDVTAFLAASTTGEMKVAVSSWRGELCTGIHDEALEETRASLLRRYESMLRALAESSQDDGEMRIAYLERLCALDPLDERSIRALMDLRARAGDRPGALREYNSLAQRLKAEVDAEPEQATTETFRRILYADASAISAHNLPSTSTSFVGRESELDEIAQALKAHRVVSLTGPAGVGKTRLAWRAALNHLGSYAGGVWFVDASVVQTGSELRSRTAQVLETSRRTRIAANAKRLLVLDNCEHVLDEARDLVDELLRSDDRLKLLATSRQRLSCACEHAIGIAPLSVPPERPSYRTEEIVKYPAVQLLLERSVTVAPSFRITPENAHAAVDILQRLDGLPLAIELVAARANLLTIEGIRKRLNDRSRAFANRSASPRHTTLDEALAWSVDLLSDQERVLFARLAVFPSSFDADAVEAICGNHGMDTIATLSELVEASLVSTTYDGDAVRYSLLVTTRSVASEFLRSSGESSAIACAHARYFAAIAETLGAADSSEIDDRIDALRADLDNFVTALSWSIETSAFETGSKLIVGATRFMKQCANSRQYLNLTERFLEKVGGLQSHSEELALCYRSAGILANTCTEWERARRYNERARHAFAATGNERAASNAQAAVAAAYVQAGLFDEAERILSEVLRDQERLNDPNTLGRALNFSGALYLATGRLDEARDRLSRALDAFRGLGDMNSTSVQLKNLALVEYHAGNLDAAAERIRQALALSATHQDLLRSADAVNLEGAILRRRGDLPGALAKHAEALEDLVAIEECHLIADVLEDTAQSCAQAGDAATAAFAAGAAAAVRSRLGAPMNPVVVPSWRQLEASMRAALGEEPFQGCFREGSSAQIGQAILHLLRAIGALRVRSAGK